MDTHDGAYVASQVSPASRHSKVLDGVEPVGVDHKIAVVLVNGWSFASVAIVEEFGHGLALDFMNSVHVEPGAVAGKNDGVRLGDEMLAGGRLDCFFRLCFLAITAGRRTLAIWRVVHLFVTTG